MNVEPHLVEHHTILALDLGLGLALARGLRDVAVREPISRSSSDMTPQLRELLGSMEVGKVTIPEITAQGLQVFALCDKKTSTGDTPEKKQVREEIFTKRFDAESAKYLEEIRRGAHCQGRELGGKPA